VRVRERDKQGTRAPEIKKASVETDASKCVQPGGLWQGLTGGTAVRAMFATAIVTAETTTSTSMMTATAAAIAVVEAALFAALTLRLGATLVLALAFRTGTKLRTTIFTAIVAAITATTAAATIVLATAVSAAIATFVTATFARTLVLTGSRCCGCLLGLIAAEEALQPAEEAGFLGFGNGWRGLRLKCARLLATFAGLLPALAELFTTLARLFATRFTRTKLVARLLRLVVTSRAVIGARRLVGGAGRAIFAPGWAEARAGIATGISTGIRLFGGTADFPALGRTNFLLGWENLELGFRFDDRFGNRSRRFDRSRGGNRCNFGDGGWCGDGRLFCRNERGGLFRGGRRFDDSGRSRLGCERVFVLCLMVNDLDGGRLIGAGGGV